MVSKISEMNSIHASIAALILLIVPPEICAQTSTGLSTEPALEIDGQLTDSSFPGVNIAQVTLTHLESAHPESTRQLTLSASLAIAPILGVTLARKLTGHSRASSRFLPSLLGAYISTAVTTFGLALLQPLQHAEMFNPTPVGSNRTVPEVDHVNVLNILIQLALPSLIPGIRIATMQTLQHFHVSESVDINVLAPALFQSPVNDRQFLLGINLITGKF
jgi:hypothetical protein